MRDKINVYKCTRCGINKYPDPFHGCHDDDIIWGEFFCGRCEPKPCVHDWDCIGQDGEDYDVIECSKCGEYKRDIDQ